MAAAEAVGATVVGESTRTLRAAWPHDRGLFLAESHIVLDDVAGASPAADRYAAVAIPT